MYVDSQASLSVIDSVFNSNGGFRGGAMFFTADSVGDVVSSTFSQPSLLVQGGDQSVFVSMGAALSLTVRPFQCCLNFKDCVFEQVSGSALVIGRHSANLRRVRFIRCWGSQIYTETMGSALSLQDGAVVTLSDALFSSCTSVQGPVILITTSAQLWASWLSEF